MGDSTTWVGLPSIQRVSNLSLFRDDTLTDEGLEDRESVLDVSFSEKCCGTVPQSMADEHI